MHLRRQCRDKRFGLVLGAGVSTGFSVPMWRDFVNAIAGDPAVSGSDLVNDKSLSKNASLPYKTELLFQRYRQQQARLLGKNLLSLEQENSIGAEWLRICQKYMYTAPSVDFPRELDSHPYFDPLVALVQASHLTVNFNFDDYLERALALRKKGKDKGTRGYEAVTNPWPQSKRTDSVVYHPHGMVPSGSLMEALVDRFVFTETGYAKQYVGPGHNDTSFLLSHFARNTCLLIGCSIEDALRTVLMQGAHINPGNYHYYVQYQEPGKPSLAEHEARAISDTNFKVYNLVTLFLDAAGIGALLELVNGDAASAFELRNLAKRSGVPLHYNFYMTGPLGVGKSTATNNLRSLVVLDEWILPRPDILGKPPEELTDSETREADAWVISQFRLKNDKLRELAEGDGVIAIVDRPPLDPLAFTPPNEWSAKAKLLLDAICPDRMWPIEKGVVILLTGNPVELSARVKATGRNDYTAARLSLMQETLLKIYPEMGGVRLIDTVGMSVEEVTRRVAELIFREEYSPSDLHSQLQQHEGVQK